MLQIFGVIGKLDSEIWLIEFINISQFIIFWLLNK